jgi:hypothetical protein
VHPYLCAGPFPNLCGITHFVERASIVLRCQTWGAIKRQQIDENIKTTALTAFLVVGRVAVIGACVEIAGAKGKSRSTGERRSNTGADAVIANAERQSIELCLKRTKHRSRRARRVRVPARTERGAASCRRGPRDRLRFQFCQVPGVSERHELKLTPKNARCGDYSWFLQRARSDRPDHCRCG